MKRANSYVVWLVLSVFPIAVATSQSTARSRTRIPAVTIQSGPMVGYSEMREVMLWAQTTGPAHVEFVYWDAAAPHATHRTRGEHTTVETAYTTRQTAENLQPGQHYAFQVIVNGAVVPRPYPLRFQTQALWQWRTDPPPFRLAVGSCLYINEPPYERPSATGGYGSEYHILTAIARTRPDAMLWLGDNTYLREVDWYARSGILRRYTHTRSVPELQPLLGSTHHYAIWDDHDYGPDDSDRSWSRKRWTLDAFKLFWANPTYGVDGVSGATTTFQWADVDFFLLDDRWDRAPNNRQTGDRSYLGERQVEWLVDALSFSKAPFKIVAVGGQVLRANTSHEGYPRYPAERQRLLDRIHEEGISGVLLLSGDLHMSELIRVERPGTYPLYELTVSPLTAGVFAEGRPDPNAIPGTLVLAHNFATLDFSGPRLDRTMKITLFDANGRGLWEREIRAAELRAAAR